MHSSVTFESRYRSSDVQVRVHLAHPVTQVAQGVSIWHNGVSAAEDVA
jgi:hypothetical protein